MALGEEWAVIRARYFRKGNTVKSDPQSGY